MTVNYIKYEGLDRDYRYGLCFCTKEEINKISGKNCEAAFIDDIAYFSSLDIPVLAHESLHISIEMQRRTVDDIDFNDLLLKKSVPSEEAFAYSYSDIFNTVYDWAMKQKGIKV